ncbi:MAG: hypothetical protein AABY44_06445 [Nitrospirota bacterium]
MKNILRILIFYSLLFTIHYSLPLISGAEIVDRIVAHVNDDVITMSELKERSRLENRDEKEVLNGMINRVLLLSEVKRLGLTVPEEDDKTMIERLIDRRINAFILIPIEKAREFYEENKDKFGGKEFLDVRDEINHYLIEEETNKRLEKYLQEIREKATIKIFY